MKREIADLTPEQRQELAVLSALPDDQINTTDAPEILDWSQAKRGLFYNSGRHRIIGPTYAKGSITGKSGVREYDFLVDNGANWVGLPKADIDTLGLDIVPNANASIYIGVGMLEGAGFVNGVVPATTPMVGSRLLQALGFKVDLVNERIEKRPADEIGPPFLL